MQIPNNTVKPKFYVAVSMTEALSSWNTLDEAKRCVDKFFEAATQEPHYFLKNAQSIIGIVETSKNLKLLHKVK